METENVSYGYRRVRPIEKRKRILAHFDAIARRYDLADTLLSFGLHALWRRTALRPLALKNGHRILDLCGGTGAFADRIAKASSGGMTVVCDLNRAMMLAGRGSRTWKRGIIQWVQGDAENLGFSASSFDVVTVGFGVRNLVDLQKGLIEIRRILKEGGALVILEFSVPVSPPIRRLYHFYSFKIIPMMAKALTGEEAPFRYLAESIRVFPPPEGVSTAMESAGFSAVVFRRLTNGIVTVYYGTKRGSGSAGRTLNS
ncbi:MAG: ubiquinone/menaquinone biosynthesis methyltransferase [Desulfobacteraceae bacterium]|nr:MAG: ubiquinone/menaquinone biosynthesis methyltransferase [Desulfobacteraceae bacterium]